jgi:uncharacterized membrane protein YqjE
VGAVTSAGSGQPVTGPDVSDHSVGELFGRVAGDLSTLLRQELELAKAEVSEKGKEVGVGAGMFGGAGVSGLLALGALTATAILALDTAMATWLAALIVTVVWAAVAGVLALTGRNRIREAAPAVPEQTIDTVKEDVTWAKNRARSARR